METVSLVGLAMLLVMVLGERERRQRARRRPEGGAFGNMNGRTNIRA